MNRLDAVRKLANRLVAHYNLTPPVDLQRIIDSFNIEVVEESNTLGIEAYTELQETPKIYINPEKSNYEPRKRFTLAHELGHIFIPWHNGDIKCDPDNSYITLSGKRLLDTQELEANIFASNLLMPAKWLESIVENNKSLSFKDIITTIAKSAHTSILACLYALEAVLPSGYVYFVKNSRLEWWLFFSSINTYTINWFSFTEDNMRFLESLAQSKQTFKIGSYEIILLTMTPCPEKNFLRTCLNKKRWSLEKLIDEITDRNRTRVLPFINLLFNEIKHERYVAYICQHDNVIKTFCVKDSPLNAFYDHIGLKKLTEIAHENGFDFESIDLGNGYFILYISEKKFEMPQYIYSDPNVLLKQICYDCQCSVNLLQSVNGVMASANGKFGKTYSMEELYSWCKYKFMFNPLYKEVLKHDRFDEYIVNKIISMYKKRK